MSETSNQEPPADTQSEPANYDPAAERKKLRRERIGLLLRDPLFLVGVFIVLYWVIAAIVPSLFSAFGPNEPLIDVGGRQGPSGAAWFGTDTVSQSVYARVIYGARPVLIMAPLAAIIATVAGTMLGLLMGYLKGLVDEILSRIVEAILSMPVIVLALMAVVVFGSSRVVLVGVVAALFTPVVARTVRSAVIGEASLDYVTSARLRGEGSTFIMSREILPNITTVVIVEFTVRVGYAIFTIATLNFLGFGSGNATEADWGRDVSNNYNLMASGQWWPTIFPALAIASLVIGFNLVADSLDKVMKA